MPGDQPAILLENVSKAYPAGDSMVPALQDVSLHIEPGEYVAIVGPSGCGKSTLLNLLAGIDTPDSGTVEINGTRLNNLGQNRLAAWRGKSVGIIFQFFQLMPTLTALENVMLPMDLAGQGKDARQRAARLLERVGLADKQDKLPSELSGGEQQRVAIARALANNPPILLGDEPTGNLDSANGLAVTEILEELWREGTTVVVVTHDPGLARRAPRVITMQDGRIVADGRPAIAEPGVQT